MEEYIDIDVYLYFCVCPCCGTYFYVDYLPLYCQVDFDGYYILVCDDCLDLD